MVFRRLKKEDASYSASVEASDCNSARAAFATGKGKYAFPGIRSSRRPMSNNEVLVALRTMEISAEEMSGHGFRAVARTLLDEVLGFRADIIEHQLAHAVKDPHGRAYNRTTHLEERRRTMQAWADYLDGLKQPGEVISFPGEASA
jgi:integrase